jgi:lysophospholipase L1-like esterase
MRRLILLLAFLTTACTQELTTNPPLPVVTSSLMTATPTQTPLPTPIPATATPIVFPAPAPLPSGPVSIIALGDDLTQGEGDDTGRGYPGRVLEIVSQIRPETGITNFGQSGWTSNNLIGGRAEFFGQLQRAVSEVESASAQGRSAVVFVWIGSNDLWELYSGTREVTPEMESQDVLRFSENISTVLRELRRSGAEVIIAKLDDQSQRPARTRGETYPAITADELERMSQQVLRYNEAISEQAELYGALIVDFYGSEIFTQPETLASDGYHPNTAGYDLIAQAWYKALIKILP